MRKFLIISIFIFILILIFLNIDLIKDISYRYTVKMNVESYFPIKQNTKYIYEKVDEDIFYEVTSDYTNENIIQLRTKSNDDISINIISVKDGKAINEITKKETLFRENLLNTMEFSNEESEDDILLMEPIVKGTKWPLLNNSSRQITNTKSIVETPVGSYEAIEVTTLSENAKEIFYYAKDIGLVKSITISEGKSTTIVLKEIYTDSPLVENIEFYYPDFNRMKILNKTEVVEFNTNAPTEAVFTEAYKNVLSKEHKVLGNEVSINNIDLYSYDTLHIDINKILLDDMEMKALYEGMILQSFVNTFGRFYNEEYVYLTIDNKDYTSDNIILNSRPFKVDFISYPLFYDIVIYGSTPSGITAAISSAREGMDVALINQGQHIGGMVTGGLSFTDHGATSIISGITREVFETIGKHYGQNIIWDFEPHIAEEAFIELLNKENIDVYYNQQLIENNGVLLDNNKLINIKMIDGDIFFGQVFIDSSYEGDLMAQSEISYVVGRESEDEYDERFAGHLPPIARNSFYYPLKGTDDEGNIYHGISIEPPGINGQGDNKVQAYNYRLCLTDNIDNQVPFYKPDNYNEEDFKLLSAWLNKIKEYENRDLKFSDVVYLGALPNNKYDVNHLGPFSTDLIGGSWEYPDANYEKREEIINNHKEYIQGLLYFISTNESTPAELRADVNKYGYAADEFRDNDHWPYQLYVREARRMVGDFVLTESDVRDESTKFDSIGMGSYFIDTHNVQRYLTIDDYVINEGEIQIPVSPYEIPYRVMLPKESEAQNLLVTICISASHVAYSSIRMEPQYMIMGEAAGIAATISINDKENVQNIDYDKLEQKLIENNAILGLKN